MISISSLRHPEVSLQWHEAVAIITELADTMSANGLTEVSAPESVFIAADGSLELRDGSTLDGLASHQLAGLLDELLSKTAVPQQLRQFVADHRAAPAERATLRDFVDGLAFFAPPARREHVAAVAQRASHVDSQNRAEKELERLAERARKKTKKEQPNKPKDDVTRLRRKTVLVAGGVAALGIIAAGGFAFLGKGSKPGRVVGSVQTRVKEIVKTGLAAVGVATPEAPLRAEPAPEPPAAPAPRVKRNKPAPKNPHPVQLTVEVKDLVGVPLTDLAPIDKPALAEPPMDETVYSAGADGVEPAVLLRPHLPSRPPASVTVRELGILELLVSQTGGVDQVRLVSSEARFHDRMIVAAAKSWRFQPATKDGSPVRSRVLIRVTL
jgi:periplasmic protein TonB